MLTESDQAAIKRSLENILADGKFSGSPQMSAFLRYVVTETLQGNAERIKAYTVAVDALGKSDSFDPQNDPSVRVLANRLRACLNQYYKRTANHEKIIEIKAGSYIPIFSEPSDFREVPTDVTPSRVVTPNGSNSPESPRAQELRAVTDKAQPIQADIKPATVTSGNGVSEAEITASGGNEAASKPASISSVETVDATTSLATASQAVEQTLQNSESGARREQQEDVPAGAPSTKNQKPAQISILTIGPLVSKVFHCAQVHKITSGSMLLIALATLTLGFNQVAGNTETASENTQDKYALLLASANDTKSLRQRPAIPTVIVRTDNRDDKVSQSLLSSISHVLSKFDHLQVLKSTHDYELAKKWPEDYEIVVDTLVMNDSRKITVNLINAASGRISYSDELFLNGDVASFSKSNIVAVARFVARIVQKNGPLLSDYKNHENYSETMACVFSVTSNSVDNKNSEDCLNKVIAQGQSETIQHSLRAEIGLVDFAKSDGAKRKAALQVAMAAARKKLDLEPYSADAHSLMMRVFQVSGDYSTALKHGNHAMDINDLDSSNMLALSNLLEEMKKTAEADEMRKQAIALSPTLFGVSL